MEEALHTYNQAAEREKEEEFQRGHALLEEHHGDLFTYLQLGEDAFDYRDWYNGEQKILKPLLQAKGFDNIGFWMIESDSFGPLTRGVRATKDGLGYRFSYG